MIYVCTSLSFREQFEESLSTRPEIRDVDGPMHVGIIMKNVARPGKKAAVLKSQFVTLLRSIIAHTTEKDIHLFIITDE